MDILLLSIFSHAHHTRQMRCPPRSPIPKYNLCPGKKNRYWRQARSPGEIRRDLRRDVSGMDGLVGLWGCDEGQGSALTDWTDNHACCLGRGGTEWVDVPRGVPVRPIRGHGRWELLAAVGLRPDFEADEQILPEEEEERKGSGDSEAADADEKVRGGRRLAWMGAVACAEGKMSARERARYV